MNKILGLLFDLDGVITDTAEYHYLAWRNLAESLNIEFTREFNENLKGISRMASLDKILKHGNKVLSQKEKEILAEIKNSEYVALIEQVSQKDILPNIENTLKLAKSLNLRIALTSASKNGPYLLEKLGLIEYFDAIVNPEWIENGKPDPEIFVTGAASLGLKPAECIGFEDAYAGIEAINAAGSFSVGIGDVNILSASDFLVSNTEELDLIAILKAANENTST